MRVGGLLQRSRSSLPHALSSSLPSGTNLVCLQSAAGAYLSAATSASFSADSSADSSLTACAGLHVFEVVDLDGYGSVALRIPGDSGSGSGSYLQAEAAGSLHMVGFATARQVGLRATFVVDEVR